jgi:DNA invertase Pin-like site-specific DNA recombinase
VKYVAYYRVSTAKQGASGLGLEAQRAIVDKYIADHNGTLTAEYRESISGAAKSLSKRKELAKALGIAKHEGATLIVAKLDRLARDAAFVLGLRAAGVEFVACDFPMANRLLITIVAAIGEYERELISQRTKDALAAAKARGVVLGGWRGGMPGADHAQMMRDARAVGVKERRRTLYPVVVGALEYADGNYNEAARLLNASDTPTTSGRGQWSAASVRRLVEI